MAKKKSNYDPNKKYTRDDPYINDGVGPMRDASGKIVRGFKVQQRPGVPRMGTPAFYKWLKAENQLLNSVRNKPPNPKLQWGDSNQTSPPDEDR